MRNLKQFLAIGAFAVMLLSLPAIASAQWRNDDDYYGNNRGGYYNNDLRQAVQNLKHRSEQFERYTDDDDNYGGYGGYGNGRNNNLERLAEDFQKAADRLDNKFGRGRNLNNSRNEAQRVVNLASQIDQQIEYNRSNSYLRREWQQIRRDVRVVADGYGIYYDNRSGWGNRRQPNTNNRNLPSWWPF